MSLPLFLGVDGGGTRCRARLETEDGRVLGHGVSGPASMRFGIDGARGAIMAAASLALAEAGLPDDAWGSIYAGIGLAGTGQIGARQALEAWRHPFAGAWFEGDGFLAWLGAFGGGDGGIVIAGTGSIGITYQNHTVRVGGFGFPVSDEGSGADLGLNALRHALRTLDGRADPSPLSHDVLARFHNSPAEVIRWVEKAASTDYASLAPLVTQHAASGDPAAVRLMRQSAAQIAELVEALLKKGAPQVALVGGLAEPLKAYMPADVAARLVQPQADAMAGGILMAKRKRAQLT
jgi:glucosamine kinase